MPTLAAPLAGRALTAAVLLAALLAGCGDPSTDAGAGGSAGQGGQGSGGAGQGGGQPPLDVLEVRLGRFVDVGLPLEPLEPGTTLVLRGAIQGGYVQYVAPQVRGLTTLQVETRARVRDPGTRYLLLEEGRTPALEPVSGDPGWYEPDLDEFRDINHLVMCPHNTDDVVLDRDLQLELTVTELEGDPPRTGTASAVVRFTCNDGDVLPRPLRCSCQCAPESQQASCQDG